MRVVFMGTPEFSVETLDSLIKAGHEVVGVVTQPDKPKGRGNKMQFSPVKEKALEHNLKVYQPVRVKEDGFIEELRSMNPEVIVVVAFGQILPKTILNMPKYGCINVHASLLPKLRGAAPIEWSIINGEKETGVTTMVMDAGIDTGDMLLKAATPILDTDTGATLRDRLAKMGADLLIQTLEKLENGTLVREKQKEEGSSYVKMLTKSLGKIDFTKSAIEIERLIRGLNPWPSAYTMLDGKTLKIWSAKVLQEDSGKAPGEIVKVGKNSLIVQTGKGQLSLLELQLEGKKRMPVDAFLRGYKVEAGTVLSF